MSTSDYSDRLPDVLDFGRGAVIDRDYFMWVVNRMINRQTFPLWSKDDLTSACIEAAYNLASKWDPAKARFATLLGNYLWQQASRLYHTEMVGYSDTTLAAWIRKGRHIPHTDRMSELDQDDERFIDSLAADEPEPQHHMAWVFDDLDWMTDSVRRVVTTYLMGGTPMYGGTMTWIRRYFDLQQEVGRE